LVVSENAFRENPGDTAITETNQAMNDVMNTGIEPLSFLSGAESLGNAQQGWTLDHTEGVKEDRHFRTQVYFARPFRHAPVVQLGITGFDICNHDAARLTTSVANITAHGFEIVLSTWFNTRIWHVNVSWFAIGS
jgi:H-type lectin domain-containing protein